MEACTPAVTRMSAPAVQKLNALTSLRFFAAAIVVLLHASPLFGLQVDPWKPLALNNGVSFFFVLSGFILTYVYGEQPRLDRGRFMLARVARIWPAHIAALILFLLMASPIKWQQSGWDVWLTNITLTHGWAARPRFYHSFVGPSWSVSVEFAFYLCFMFLVQRLKQTWPWKLALAFGLVILTALLATLWQPNDVTLGENHHYWISGLMYFSPYARLFEFVLGMATALFWRQTASKFQWGPVTGSLLEVATLLLALLVMSQANTWSAALNDARGIGKPSAVWLRSGGAACLAFAVLILVMAQERGWLSRLLGHKLPVLFGEISYSIYLLHMPLLALWERQACWLTAQTGWMGFVLFSVMVLAGSYLMWALIECPCRRYLTSLWPKPSEVSAQAPTRSTSPSLSSWQGIAASLVVLAGVFIVLLQTSSRHCEGKITMLTPAGQPYTGALDRADHDLISGWAWNSQKPTAPVQVEIYDGKKLVLTVTASEHRADLVNHLGNCAHGFNVVTPQRFKDGRPHHLHVRIASSGFELPNPARWLLSEAASGSVSQARP